MPADGSSHEPAGIGGCQAGKTGKAGGGLARSSRFGCEEVRIYLAIFWPDVGQIRIGECFPGSGDSGAFVPWISKGKAMAYVVTAPCFGCKYTDCVVVCPCSCFHEGEQMLYINPDDCIDCDACRGECPVEAIFPDWEVPPEWSEFIALNRNMAEVTPPITEKKTPLC